MMEGRYSWEVGGGGCNGQFTSRLPYHACFICTPTCRVLNPRGHIGNTRKGALTSRHVSAVSLIDKFLN